MSPKAPPFSLSPESFDHPAAANGSAESASRAAALHNDSFPPVPKPEQRASGPAGTAPTDSGKTQWTMAIDLAASQDGADGGGALNQQKRLEALAEKTRGVNVAIVVQVVQPTRREGNTRGHSDTFVHKGDDGKGGEANNHPLERFVIRNGTITKIGDTTTSKGYSQDVTDLLQVANQQAPSQKLGLIVQSHGGASDGLQGDNGSATLSEFTQAISAGLKDSGHAKLDLVDFDACSMGNLDVVEKLAPLANHMVASSEVESSGKHAEFDAQNLQATVTDLLNHPEMSGSELAEHMVAQAKAGTNDGFNTESKKTESGTPTLAHFDLDNISFFNSSLNELGTALANANSNPSERAAINKAINDAPQLPAGGMSVAGHPHEDRDLKSFTDKLMQSLNSGEIGDPALKNALLKFTTAENRLVPSYHGAADGHYDTQGGLTAFLPDLRIRDTSDPSIAPNLPFGQLEYQTAKDNDFATLRNKDIMTRNINAEIDDTQKSLGSSHVSEIAQLRNDATQVAAATTQSEFRAALDHLGEDVKKLSKSDFKNDLIRNANTENRDRRFESESLPLIGWQAFMESLRGSST